MQVKNIKYIPIEYYIFCFSPLRLHIPVAIVFYYWSVKSGWRKEVTCVRRMQASSWRVVTGVLPATDWCSFLNFRKKSFNTCDAGALSFGWTYFLAYAMYFRNISSGKGSRISPGRIFRRSLKYRMEMKCSLLLFGKMLLYWIIL